MTELPLNQQVCDACNADAEPVLAEQYAILLADLPSWQIVDKDTEGKRLQKIYKFKNFLQALAFTQRVGDLAEQYNHHPALLTEWGKVTVSWWTHKISGLHQNDFILAAKTDVVYDQHNKGL